MELLGINRGVVKVAAIDWKIIGRLVTVCELSTQLVETEDPLCR